MFYQMMMTLLDVGPYLLSGVLVWVALDLARRPQ
jgi:hypothetical protein